MARLQTVFDDKELISSPIEMWLYCATWCRMRNLYMTTRGMRSTTRKSTHDSKFSLPKYSWLSLSPFLPEHCPSSNVGLSFKSRLPSTSPNLPILLSQNWLLLSSKMQTGRMKIYVLALCFAASSAQMEYFQVGRVERWRGKRPRGRCHDESNVHPLCLQGYF